MSEDGNYLANMLAAADETYASVPPEVWLQIDEIAKSLPEYGPRKMRKTGPGAEFYDAREYRPGLDDLRTVNAKLSARHGRKVVVEYQAENRQPVFFWRKGQGTTTAQYDKDRWTKKEYLEIAFLAAAKAIASKEDMIGVLDGGGLSRGSSGVGNVAAKFFDVNIITGSLPTIGTKIPFGSTVILGSDFFARPEERAELEEALFQLHSMGANGRLCMVVDPVELDFDEYKGHIRFNGKEGEAAYISEKAEALKQEFNEKMNKYVEWVKDLAQSNGYEFILQRTDTPPLDLVLKVFGINPESPAPRLEL